MPPKAAKRIDPPARSVNSDARSPMIKGLRADRHYVRVYKADNVHGIQYYEDLGYVVELYSKDSPKLRGKEHNPDGSPRWKEGQPIEHMDYVLMSISKEEHERIQLEGAFGDSGQQWADALEERIVDRSKGVDDPMRGMRGIRGSIGFQNQTSAPEVE